MGARQCVEEYIRTADWDAQYLGKAYYSLAMMALDEQVNLGQSKEEQIVRARRYFDRGIDAEAKQLQCFKGGRWDDREFLASFLAYKHACGWESCLKLGVLKCSGCRSVYYCGPVCQKASWKRHKQVCKPSQPQVKSCDPHA